MSGFIARLWQWLSVVPDVFGEGSKGMAKFQIYKSKNGWRWRLFAKNGKLVAESGEAFARKPTLATLEKITATFAAARVDELADG